MKLTQIVPAAIISTALLSFAPSLKAQTGTITAWNFENETAGVVYPHPAPSTGTGTATAIGMTAYSTGTLSTDVLLGVAGDTGTTTNTTSSDVTNTWRIRAKGSGSGNTNGWSSLAPIASQGAQFAASTTGYTTGAIQIGFDFYVTSQAESNMEVLYTTNGSTWQNVALTLGSSTGYGGTLTEATGTDSLTTSGSYVHASGGQDWFQGLTATITDPSALNDSNFAFEVVNASTGADVTGASGGAYNNSSGNWRLDNIVISDVAAAPEPASWLLAFAACGLFAVVRRYRSANRA